MTRSLRTTRRPTHKLARLDDTRQGECKFEDPESVQITQEHSLPAVCCADVGGADATQERVIPRFGQVAEYAVETSACPAKRGDILHDGRSQ
jgi:hypothetical protein